MPQLKFESPLLRDITKNFPEFRDPYYNQPDVNTKTASFSCKFEPPRNGLINHGIDTGWDQNKIKDSHTYDEAYYQITVSNLGYATINISVYTTNFDDSENYCISTTIDHSEELRELMEFYQNANIRNADKRKAQPVPLNQLIEKVGLYYSHNALPVFSLYSAQNLIKQYPDEYHHYNRYFNPEDQISKDHKCIVQSLDAYDALYDEISEKAEPILPQDILISHDGAVTYGAALLDGSFDSGNSIEATLILRPSTKASCAWLLDYFRYASEATEVKKQIIANWSKLPKGLAKIPIDTFSLKNHQIIDCVERRLARSDYRLNLQKCLDMPEPFHSISSSLKKRTSIVSSLHTELLDDMVAIQSPLPFFLEYPYQNFRKQDDPVRKVKAAQRLLGVLIKVPLFLILEELSANGCKTCAKTLEQIRSRPPSDGSLLDFLKTTIKKHNSEDLDLFKPLAGSLGTLSIYNDLITARNRMHHEPYDEEGFLEAMSETAPQIIDLLRAPLSQLKFIIPTNMQMKDGKKNICAEDISNSDGAFRKLELTIGLPFENFPSEELVVYRSEKNNEASLTLTQLFASKPVMQQSRDFGLFDRTVKNEPQFVYLRSE